MNANLDNKKYVFEILFILFLFILFSFIVHRNIDFISSLFDTPFGMLVYIFIVILAVVIAPVSALPLLPVASQLWGWFLAGIFGIIGWTIGGLIAFEISRKYGVPLVKTLIPLEDLYKIEKKIPSKNIFWSIVFLRLLFPVDILSYALGLFSKISRKDFILTTLIGVTPFAFAWAYLGSLPIYYQIVGLWLASMIFLTGWLITLVRKKLKIRKKREG